MSLLLAAFVLALTIVAPSEPPPDGTIAALGESLAPTEEAANPPPAGVVVRPVTYLSDGLKVEGYLAVPAGKGPFPVLIVNRGGNREFGAWTEQQALMALGTAASWGYVVVASQYRGNGGGEGEEEFGGADVDDVLSLIPLVEKLPQADSKRIGMMGWSRGGLMTYLALAKTDRIAAAIVGGGISDSFDLIRRRPEMAEVYKDLVPDFETAKNSALEARSAVRWPEKLCVKTPILILHGTADWRVAPQQAIAMADALLQLKRPFRLILFEGGDHGLTDFAGEVSRAQREWLDRYVRDGQKWPDLEPHGE